MLLNRYFEHLKMCIDNSCETAEKEFSAQSLESSQFDNMRQWYAYVYDWITRNPPEYYVDYLEVKENYNLEIVEINYVYFDESEKVTDTSIKIFGELYNA